MGKKSKGKTAKGRAGAKQKAQRGTRDIVRRSADSDEYDDDTHKSFMGFAQSRSNNARTPPRDPSLKLRYQTIAFVSAGSNAATPAEREPDRNRPQLSEEAIRVQTLVDDSEEPDDIEEDQEGEGEGEGEEIDIDFDEDENDDTLQTNTVIANAEADVARMNVHTVAQPEMPDTVPNVQMTAAESRERASSPAPLPFVIDTVGDADLATSWRSAGKQTARRAPSPAASDSSSEEVVLFHGRNRPAIINDPVPSTAGRARQAERISELPNAIAAPAASTLSTTSAFADHSGSQTQGQRPNPSQAHSYNRLLTEKYSQENKWAAGRSKVHEEVNPNPVWAPAPAGSWWRKGKQRPDLNPSPAEVRALESAPKRETKVTFAPHPAPTVPATDVAESDVMKRVERLGKILRVQAQDDANPPTTERKILKMEARIANIAALRAELSPQHVLLAQEMAASEAARLKYAAEDRGNLKMSKRHVLLAGPGASSKQAPIELDHSNDAEQTIANLQADWKAVIREKKENKMLLAQEKTKESGNDMDEDEIVIKSASAKRRGKRGRKKDNRLLKDPNLSEDEADDGEAAYDDYMANLVAQLESEGAADSVSVNFSALRFTQSEYIAGPSLVVDGREIPEDEVMDEWEDEEEEEEEEDPYHTGMNGDDESSASSRQIGQDVDDMSDLDSSELEEALEYTEQQQWEDEDDLRRRNQERMTDEQLARILAKQEELGIHGDDIVLEDGYFMDNSEEEVDGIGDITAARAGLSNFTFGLSPSSKHTKRRSANRGGNVTFPDASALADTVEQYGESGFDIMDFDRPSLRKTPKGRKGKLPPELEALSDEELQASMLETWANDRSKKRLKKAEREELRAQGLLGSMAKKGKVDLAQKYQYGISTKQIHAELREFLQNDGQNSRSFPPMDKHDRKDLHELAVVLGLSSKSVGSGRNRFPVLYKTSRTQPYGDYAFSKAVAASERGWLDSDRKFGKRGARAGRGVNGAGGKAPKGFGGGASAATMRDGEVVGAGAKVIGKENFGHKLMEKMGWSQGMALGKEGEGRLVPVEQIVRTGRSGLG